MPKIQVFVANSLSHLDPLGGKLVSFPTIQKAQCSLLETHDYVLWL